MARADVEIQLRRLLPGADAQPGHKTPHGGRWRTATAIVGPNGKQGTLSVVWPYDRDPKTGVASPFPRIVTNWLAVHSE